MWADNVSLVYSRKDRKRLKRRAFEEEKTKIASHLLALHIYI